MASENRRVSGLERLWLTADRLAPPFVGQMILEGQGRVDPGRRGWDGVMRELAQAQPACRARLRGRLFRSRWVADGALPRVREVAGDSWNGRGPEGADFLQDPMSPRTGPACELVIVTGSPTRMVLRTQHTSMDGRAMVLMAQGLFAILRGETPPTAELGTLNDQELARSLDVPAEKMAGRTCVSPTGPARDFSMEMTWGCRHFEGKFNRLLGRLALAVKAAAPEVEGDVRIDVPVDMRRHRPGLSSSANLTGMIRLSARDLPQGEDPVDAVAQLVRAKLAENEEAQMVRRAEFARFVPVRLMAHIARRQARRSLENGRFGSTALISNFGKLEIDRFGGAGFQAERCFIVPPGNPGLPLFLTCVGSSGGVDLCGAMPRALASGGRLEGLLEGLGEAIRG